MDSMPSKREMADAYAQKEEGTPIFDIREMTTYETIIMQGIFWSTSVIQPDAVFDATIANMKFSGNYVCCRQFTTN